MKSIRLVMVRDHMDHLPSFSCPDGYRIRTFVRDRGDERRWAEIESAAGEFPDQQQALRRFDEDFGQSLGGLEDRCFILEDARGDAIGTATAWYGRVAGEERGRVHWVGIVPDHQGRGLSKPLLSAVMARLAEHHQKAYLSTRTTNYRAVNLYLAYDFVPYLTDGSSEEGWSMMEHVLHRKFL